mgnify:CR=1 FL=1
MKIKMERRKFFAEMRKLGFKKSAMKHKIKLCNSLGCEESMQKKDFTVTGFLSNFEAGVTFTFRGTDSEFSKWFDGENLRELEDVGISTETLT